MASISCKERFPQWGWGLHLLACGYKNKYWMKLGIMLVWSSGSCSFPFMTHDLTSSRELARFLVPEIIYLLLSRELLVTAKTCVPLLHPEGHHSILAVVCSHQWCFDSFSVAICIPVVFCVLIIWLPICFPLYLFLSMPVSQKCVFGFFHEQLFLSCVFKFFLISLTYLSRTFILDYKGILPRYHTLLFLSSFECRFWG